jgi:hypothetical protein
MDFISLEILSAFLRDCGPVSNQYLFDSTLEPICETRSSGNGYGQ